MAVRPRGSRPLRATRPAVVAGMLLSVVVLGSVWAPLASAAPQDRVTICHRDRSVRSPYVRNTVDENSIIEPNGHGTHTGPVFPALGWGDIIPPFPYTDANGAAATYPGLNWDTEGKAIWNAPRCGVEFIRPPEPTESPTPSQTSTPPSETSTPPPGSPRHHPRPRRLPDLRPPPRHHRPRRRRHPLLRELHRCCPGRRHHPGCPRRRHRPLPRELHRCCPGRRHRPGCPRRRHRPG